MSTCAQKLTSFSLVYHVELTTEMCIKEELKVETDMRRSIDKQWNQSWERKGRLWWEGFAEKEVFKPGVKEWRGDGWWEQWVKEMPLKELGVSELERLVRGWRRDAGSWLQRRVREADEVEWVTYLLLTVCRWVSCWRCSSLATTHTASSRYATILHTMCTGSTQSHSTTGNKTRSHRYGNNCKMAAGK